MWTVLGVLATGWVGLIAWEAIQVTSLLRNILNELKRIQ